MNKISREQKLQKILETEKILTDIQDVDVLLERLLTEARGIVHADAGSIYVYENEKLSIKYAQNDTQRRKLAPGQKLPFSYFSFAVNEKSIAGFSVLKGTAVNISDAYALSPELPYSFNKQSDSVTGYRTKSILTLPLRTAAGKILGVLQMINALDTDGTIISFDEDAELFLTHFASAATQALERAYLTRSMVMRMITMAGFRDPKETGGHVLRVSSYAVEIYDRWAFENHIPEDEQHKFRDALKIAAMLHDVGKVGIPDVILKKPGSFTDEEYAIIKTHTYLGACLFAEIESPLDEMARAVALHHHERWDGTGYPGNVDLSKITVGDFSEDLCTDGLAGEEIPLAARIVALADVFDALSSKRIYKQAWNERDVLAEILAESGKQFDPQIVSIFFKVQPQISEIRLAYPDAT
ncbi:HD-GYP domain-containing protein [Treponema brennaborense]|uniref:Metal dependent phosphohydrolase with GAF sensor n=1 Tax=Treponema brennaborense (strain DSM 12168 / CIP 105900 / DD5/3) TaxID=906968 RepID=F4LJH5_TREBD|nr:HD-GYP domain-containing protein [Treponema brennaborense]AEE16370.1 metal dependent phosphohydrolase with GAF sensor [Treponema brennaborense DSM 12168]